MQEYTGLKALYLEQNAISKIENLESLVNLRCLYLGRNMLQDISGLQNLVQLDSLDLSENYIEVNGGSWLFKCLMHAGFQYLFLAMHMCSTFLASAA